LWNVSGKWLLRVHSDATAIGADLPTRAAGRPGNVTDASTPYPVAQAKSGFAQ